MALLKILSWRRSGFMFLAAAMVLWASVPGEGHTRGRVRLGHRHDPVLTALARLTQIYFEEISPYQVELRRYESAADLAAAIEAGLTDLALEYPADIILWKHGEGVPAEGLVAAAKERLRRNFGAVMADAFPWRIEEKGRYSPTFVVSRHMAEDLAYYDLPLYLGKLAAGITESDIAEYLKLDPEGQDRKHWRALLAGKKMI